ncbi:kinesin-like protein KIF20A [Notolabrus celidotus]|uniref:kinesin-like protein KIF20A n=1 Tax=Notolabrus celidotus TaxID=1203425 RepID=UPI0014905F5B|nr:kinesin-like protein KIF20A [Notolabrus celidotus]
MMESCLGGKPERVGPVEVDDIRKDLLGEFAALPAQDSDQSQSENLQVYLRVRPFTAAESDHEGSQECVTIEGPDTVVLKAPRICQSNRQNEKSFPQTAQRFSFTQVFGPDSSQRKVFEGSVRGLARDVLDGGNCLVFTYGVTNAGKTFTFLGPDHDSGLLPRSLSVIFNSIEGRLYGRMDLKPQRCRDFSRLTPDQQAAESSSKKNLLRLLKESDKSLTTGRSTFLDGSSLSTDSSVNSVSDSDSFCLDVASNVRYSVWVSFCEIYNDNIHDLLEQVPSGHQRRTVLRLSQDVKGNSFIKDLRWVQVNSSEEAYRVMKIGKKNQSFSSTRLNHLSSRSHSIFSIRILKVDDVGVPRVLGISELALCDLAGSERCSRTHNTGERLKEAGNINSSLLTLGKCINAMRLNQNAKFTHHVPFRESKLTHFLQFFFCGAGRVSMVVNINQNSASFDETLNVLKFSALAQKVVVLNTRPVVVDDAPQRSALELSMIIDEADQRRNVSGRGRKSSLLAWETTLEDVMEGEDGEEWGEEEEEEEEEEESMMEGTVLEAGGEEEEEDRTMEEEGKMAALRLVLEAQIREEVSAEFMELFNKMEKDYSERLEKEREILEERAEKRVEILKNLVSKTVDLSAVSADNTKQEQTALLEGIISSMTEDLEKIKEDAQSAHRCLTDQSQAAELEALRLEKQQSHDQLQEAAQSLEQQKQKLSGLMEICQQKDDIINKLQAAMDDAAESATRDRALVESIKSELLELQKRRSAGEEREEEEKRKRQREEEEEERGPARKRVVLEDEIWRLQEESDKKDVTIEELREREERRRGLEEELRRREEEVEELKKEQALLEQKVLQLTDLDECPHCASVFGSLESEQRETSRLLKENKALVNGMFRLQTEVTDLQSQLKQKTGTTDSLSEQLRTVKTRLQDQESQSEEKTGSISSLTQEVERLRREMKEEEGRSSSVFHATMEELRKESQAALERSTQKSKQIQDLQRERTHLQEDLRLSQDRCVQLTEEAANQKAELQSVRAELESESGALQRKLEETERSEEERKRSEEERKRSEEERKRSEEERKRSEETERREREELLEDSVRQTEALRTELERLKEELQRREEEEEEGKENREVKEEEEEGKENREAEERKVPMVEELKEEILRLQERRERQQEEEEEEKEGRSREFDAVRREMERLKRLKEERERERERPLQGITQRCGGRVLQDQDARVSPLRPNMADRKRTAKTTGRKRKSCEVQGLVFSENKRNRVRNTRNDKQAGTGTKEKRDGALQKIGELIHSSPSILSSKAKTLLSLVSGPEAVTTETKPKRGRRKLFKKDAGSPLFDSPRMTPGGAEEEKESDHLIIKRQLRSKTCRK